ncbi:hypothetical protein SUGI_0325310 [Cryptomeria japonica]|nr:hypothetical protein SUGI_0325310 [Cryptomeria japonica]
MVVSFGVQCLCASREDLSESPEEQIYRLFQKAEDKEKETLIQEDVVGVKSALNELITHPTSGIMIGYFNLNAEGKNTKMGKAWNIYKARVGKDNSLDKFVVFMKENKEHVPKEMVERLVDMGKGMAYLYH